LKSRPAPQPRSQLVTVRRPRAKSSPVQSRTNRACWRASSASARVVIQTTSATGSHCASIYGSPSHRSVAYPTTACGESRLTWKSPAQPRTTHELSDFWESAVPRLAGRLTRSFQGTGRLPRLKGTAQPQSQSGDRRTARPTRGRTVDANQRLGSMQDTGVYAHPVRPTGSFNRRPGAIITTENG